MFTVHIAQPQQTEYINLLTIATQEIIWRKRSSEITYILESTTDTILAQSNHANTQLLESSPPNMIGSNPTPAGGLVIETGYVTVYPSVVESFTIDLSTLATRYTSETMTVASSTMAADTSLPSTQVATSSFHSEMSSSSSIPSSAPLSTTGIPALPSSTAAPEHRGNSKLWKDHIASLALTAIILVILVLLSLMVYAIYQRIRGRCYKCVENERQLEKYKNGELKHISPAMVKIREKSQVSTVWNGAGGDVEMGPLPNSSEQRNIARQEALDRLNGPPELAKLSIWDRAKGAAKATVKGKGNGKQPQAPEPDEERTIGGPVYTETEVESFRRSNLRPAPPPPQVQDHDSDTFLDHAYEPPSPPSPSMYSRPGASDVGPLQEQKEHYYPVGPRLHSSTQINHDRQPTTYSAYLETTWRPRNEEHLREQAAGMRDDASVVSSALNTNDPRHRVRYDDAQRTMARGAVADSDMHRAVKDVNTVENQMRKKRRSRAYGGLPHPEDFDDVDIGNRR